MYGGSQHVQSTHKGGGGTPALRTTMRLWHLWSLQRAKHLEGWFWLCTSLLSPSGFVSFHICLWIFAWSSYHHSAVTCVMCVQMWRLVDFSAILGCESTLTGIYGLASELHGPPGSDPSILDYRHCNWLLHGARDMESGPHGCAASALPTEPSLQACYSGECNERLPFLHLLLHGQDNHRVTFINTKWQWCHKWRCHDYKTTEGGFYSLFCCIYRVGR